LVCLVNNFDSQREVVKKRLIYIDQLVGPNSVDVVNALCDHYDVHLYYGSVIITYTPFDFRVKHHKRNSYDKGSILGRLISWILFYGTTLPVVLFKRKDHLFLVSNPPLNFFFGFVFNILTHTKFSLLLWDIYPDIIIQSGVTSKGNPISRIWSFLNSIAFPKASRIFTVSEFLASEIAKYRKGLLTNIRVIPTWTDAEKIKPIPKEENLFISEYNLFGKFVVMYSGNMGKTHDLETLIEVAELMIADTDVVFVLIGDGEKREKIVQQVSERRLRNVMVLPFQEPEMFPKSIASADIGIVTLAAGFENYSVPSKTYYLMAAGAVIFAIAKGRSELESIIGKFECGYRFDPGDANAIVQEIKSLSIDKAKRVKLSENSRKAALQFTLKNATTIANEVATA
jgi:glycosyltransferase involved in cell wall biosynthesis